MVRSIPERFKKVTFVFDASRLCVSSGSGLSPATESPTGLSDMVISFVEGEISFVEGEDKTSVEETAVVDEENDVQDDGSKAGSFDFEATKESLKKIFGCVLGEGDEDRRKIFAEVEAAFESIGHHENNSHDFKGGSMAFLRKRGFDADESLSTKESFSCLCKSRWEKTVRFPAGEYHYVDVNVNGARYIVEASLQVVRLLSAAIKQSLQSRGLLMPPWRKSSYMKAKWFSSYKRTMKRASASNPKCTNAEDQSITGFKAPGLTAGCYYREDFARNNRIKSGLLSEALAGHSS